MSLSPRFVNPVDIPALEIEGSERAFAVRRILCVAKNYAAHAREMGADPERERPRFFDKPIISLLPGGGTVRYPRASQSLHHEVEWVIAIGSSADGPVGAERAESLVCAVGCGIDLTRRDLQADAKAARGPWDLAKGFAGSAPVGLLRPTNKLPRAGRIRLWVNNELRQAGDVAEMIWSGAEVLAELSLYDDLRAGDLVFTGTPSGVGPLIPGDRVRGEVEGVGGIELFIAP
ncbi:MAG: fumarylacetoacetate hydrolase family protein [Myxococcota bacterium]